MKTSEEWFIGLQEAINERVNNEIDRITNTETKYRVTVDYSGFEIILVLDIVVYDNYEEVDVNFSSWKISVTCTSIDDISTFGPSIRDYLMRNIWMEEIMNKKYN